MTLVQLAEFLINNNETVYNEGGTCISRRHNFPISHWRVSHTVEKLHHFYSVEQNGKLHTLGVEGNAMFCLLVNEAMK